MIVKMIEKIASYLPKRNISRKDNNLYLTRYYIFRRPIKWLPSIYLHCFHDSDEDQELHNHPFWYSVSFILNGSYKEEYRDKDKVKTKIFSAGKINIVKANKFHRVDLLTDKVWTLFISGPKTQDWGFWDRHTYRFIPWQEFEEYKTKKREKEIEEVNIDILYNFIKSQIKFK